MRVIQSKSDLFTDQRLDTSLGRQTKTEEENGKFYYGIKLHTSEQQTLYDSLQSSGWVVTIFKHSYNKCLSKWLLLYL